MLFLLQIMVKMTMHQEKKWRWIHINRCVRPHSNLSLYSILKPISNLFIWFKLAQSSNQTTVSNIVGGSNSVSTTLKRKRAPVVVDTIPPLSTSSKKRSAKSGILADITNICPTPSSLPFNRSTPSTSGSCISKISTEGNSFNLNLFTSFKLFLLSMIGSFY